MNRRQKKKIFTKVADKFFMKSKVLWRIIRQKRSNKNVAYFIMYLCDINSYRLYGKSISGLNWMKTENGVRPHSFNEKEFNDHLGKYFNRKQLPAE